MPSWIEAHNVQPYLLINPHSRALAVSELRRVTDVGADEASEVVRRTPGFTPQVADLEEWVVVARVLVVDEPESIAVVDDVGRQQVVVAWNGRDRLSVERLTDGLSVICELEVAVGES